MSFKKVSKSASAKKRAAVPNDQQSKLPNPISVAKWLFSKTALTFDQIGKITELSEIEVSAIADGFAGNSVADVDPVARGYFLASDIKKAEQDPSFVPSYIGDATHLFDIVRKKAKFQYTPVVVRYNRISGAMWLFNEFPKIPAQNVMKFLSVAKNIAESIKNKTYKNVYNLEAKDPVLLNLCTTEELKDFAEQNKSYKVVHLDK